MFEVQKDRASKRFIVTWAVLKSKIKSMRWGKCWFNIVESWFFFLYSIFVFIFASITPESITEQKALSISLSNNSTALLSFWFTKINSNEKLVFHIVIWTQKFILINFMLFFKNSLLQTAFDLLNWIHDTEVPFTKKKRVDREQNRMSIWIKFKFKMRCKLNEPKWQLSTIEYEFNVPYFQTKHMRDETMFNSIYLHN